MQRPEEIRDVKEKIHARARQIVQHVAGSSVWAGSGEDERLGTVTRISVEVNGEQKEEWDPLKLEV